MSKDLGGGSCYLSPPPPCHGAQWDPSKPSCACAHTHRLTDRLLRTSACLALPFPTCCAISALFTGRKGSTLPGAPAGTGMALAALSAPAAVAVPPGSTRVGGGAHLTYLCLPHPGPAPGTHEALERLLNEHQCRPGPSHSRNGACPAPPGSFFKKLPAVAAHLPHPHPRPHANTASTPQPVPRSPPVAAGCHSTGPVFF